MSDYVDGLAQEIENAINLAVENCMVDREQVAQFIIGVSQDKQSVLLWQNDEWDDYNEYQDYDAFAEVSNAKWLDKVDALLPDTELLDNGERPLEKSTLQFADEKLNNAYLNLSASLVKDLIAVLKKIAVGDKLGEFNKIVGLMAQGILNSGYADLVAFYHPLGDRQIWPIHEQRGPYPSNIDIYQFGALTDEGITMFYPEGEGDGLDSNKQPATTKTYKFSEMEYYFPSRDEIRLRPKGDLFDIQFCHGHTHEEWGGPTQEDIDQALIKHFAPHKELFFDENRMPDPKDTVEHQRWIDLYFKLRKDRHWAVVDNAVEDHGPDAAQDFIKRLPEDDENRPQAIRSLAEALFKLGDFEQCVQVMESLEIKERIWGWEEEMRSLLMLKRYEALLTAAALIEKGECEEDRCKKTDKLAPYKALALNALDRTDEAIKILDAVNKKQQDATYWWSRAHVFYNSDMATAKSSMQSALSSYYRPPLEYTEIDLAGCTELLEMVATYQQCNNQCEAQKKQVKEISQAVESPVVDLDSSSAFEKALSGEATKEWFRSEEIGYEGDGSFDAVVLDPQGRSWVALDSGGFAQLDISDPLKPRFIYVTETGSDINAIGFLDNWLFAADSEFDLRVYDIKEAQAKEVATAKGFFTRDYTYLSLDKTLLALGCDDGVCLYDIHNPTEPELVGLVGTERCESIYLKGHILYIAAGSDGLIIFDVNTPETPKLLAVLECKLGENEGIFSAENIELKDGIARLYGSGCVWIVNVCDPNKPKSICLVGDRSEDLVAWIPLPDQSKDSQCYLVIDQEKPIVWTIELFSNKPAKRISAEPILDAESTQARLVYAEYAIIADDGTVVVLCDDEFIPLVSRDLVRVGDAKLIEENEDRVFDWVVECLKNYASEYNDRPTGIMVMSTGSEMEVAFEKPRSVVGIEYGPISRFDENADPIVSYEREYNEFYASKEQCQDDEEIEYNSRSEAQIAANTDAWAKVLKQVAKRIVQHESLSTIASGRVYIATFTHGQFMVVQDIKISKDKDWKPWRRKIEAVHSKPLEEVLSDYGNIDKYVEASRNDEVLRKEVFELASTGPLPALLVAWHLRDEYEEDVVELFKHVAQSSHVNDTVINGLGHYIERPEVKTLLENLFDSSPDDLEVVAALAKVLQRGDDDRMVATVRYLLEDENAGYVEQDAAVQILKSMDKALPTLIPVLKAHIARCDEWDNRVPELCEQLFRAGDRELPKQLIGQAKNSKSHEEYVDDSFMEDLLGDDDDAVGQVDAPRIERLYTGAIVINHMHELNNKGDSENSIWPDGLEHEPYPSSWKFLMESILHQLDESGELLLVKTLCSHTRDNSQYKADRSLLLALFDIYTDIDYSDPQPLDIEIKTLRRIAKTIIESDAFSKKEKNKAKVELHTILLQRGWELFKSGELREARVFADELLEIEPENGQVMFFETRIHWMEQDGPKAGIERAEYYLKRLGDDPAGRGRLLNLIGCALDELGKVAEALPYFERAAQAHTQDATYIANIAECYEKLGNMDEAYKWAKNALQRKAKSELCERIIREHEEQ